MSEAHLRAKSGKAANASPPEACPWQVQVVAAIFMFGTVESSARIAVDLFHDKVTIDFFPIIGLLIVLGLLRGWPAGRVVALFFAALGIACFPLGLGLALYLGPSGTSANYLYVFGEGAVKAALWAGACLDAFISLVSVWVWRVLRSDRVRGFFQEGIERSVPKSTKLLWVVAGILALVVVSAKEYVKYRGRPTASSQSIAFGGTLIGAVETGSWFDRLGYVVFQEGEAVSTKVQRYGGQDWDAWLTTPEGGRIRLPNKVQLYEVVGDQLHQSPVRVTREEFEAFMSSNPEHYSIKALLFFLGTPDKPE